MSRVKSIKIVKVTANKVCFSTDKNILLDNRILNKNVLQSITSTLLVAVRVPL